MSETQISSSDSPIHWKEIILNSNFLLLRQIDSSWELKLSSTSVKHLSGWTDRVRISVGSGGGWDALASRWTGLPAAFAGRLPGLSVGCVCLTVLLQTQSRRGFTLELKALTKMCKTQIYNVFYLLQMNGQMWNTLHRTEGALTLGLNTFDPQCLFVWLEWALGKSWKWCVLARYSCSWMSTSTWTQCGHDV